MRLRLLPFVFVCVFAAAPVFAQGLPPEPVPHDQIVSANPFGIVASWFNVEYERKLTRTTTWGMSASMWDLFDRFEYRNAQALFRFYPQGRALDGIFLGVRAGVHHVSAGNPSDLSDGGTYGGAGFEIGYTWLIGASDRVGLSIGAGASRLFGGGLDGARLVLPTLRLVNVGIAF